MPVAWTQMYPAGSCLHHVAQPGVCVWSKHIVPDKRHEEFVRTSTKLHGTEEKATSSWHGKRGGGDMGMTGASGARHTYKEKE